MLEGLFRLEDNGSVTVGFYTSEDLRICGYLQGTDGAVE